MTARKTPALSRSDRWLQIGMAALGAALLIGSLTIVLKDVGGPLTPARIEVTETGRRLDGARTVLQIRAVNRGDETAAAVTIEGRAGAGDPATVTLDYVPGRSRRDATLAFPGDIGSAPVDLSATGWTDP